MNATNKIIQKIKKLLAMAEHANSNPNEAARAAGMAAKMMEEYQIEKADVIKTELKMGGGVMDSPISDLEYASWPIWMQSLAINTAKLFECQVNFVQGSSGKKKRIKLMGYQADVQMVIWMYEFLHDELTRLAKREVKINIHRNIHGSKVKASFLSGAVMTLRQRFEEIINERLAARSNSSTDLMVIKQDAINEKYGMAKYSNKKTTRVDMDSYNSGTEAGKTININRPLGSQQEQRKLG